MSYNGQEITYDEIANPISYYNGFTFSWQGRRLVGATRGNDELSFTYNDDGIRTSKTVNGVKTTYYLSGSLILAEVTPSYEIMYIYDASGSPVGMQYRSFTYANGVYDVYFFEKNLQGDILAVYGANGTKYIEYTYDSWGSFTTTYHNGGENTSAVNNRFTYRGYYYDSDLGMYYLNARYYDQNIRRFINADNRLSMGSSLTGLNLFAYCGNNPVNRTDYSGEAWWHWAIGAAIVVACAVATVVTCGGFAAAAGAVTLVANGVAAATTASTIAAGAFIGSATVYGLAVFSAASTSSSVQDFNEEGTWGTVAGTAFGALTGGWNGYTLFGTQSNANEETFLPDSYYSKHAPKQSVPNSKYVNYSYNSYTGNYEKSTATYDFAGRQVVRIDWTNHGYSNHGNPHVHYTTFNSQYPHGFTVRWD